MQRKIPATMVTQHPDHVNVPYWHHTAFIKTQDESEECYRSFSELGASEYKWDWEGKFVDESVIERLFNEHYDYFKDHPLGKEKFLTFRLPNPKVETEFRIGRALVSIAGAAPLAKHFGVHTPPLFEVILPMTETAEEIIAIHKAFAELAGLKHNLFRIDTSLLPNIDVIPLFEQVEVITNADVVLQKYFALYKKQFGTIPQSLRPYLARSDPALNAGLIPTVLAIKIALSKFKALESASGVQLFPIIGAASLPFRGGLTPHTIDTFIDEYSGVRTTTLQSAFRYDYDKRSVRSAIRELEERLPKTIARPVSPEDEKELRLLINELASLYKETVEACAPIINKVANHLPRRRERVQHIGLFGYSRGVGKVKLPRAIGFTAACYSLGIPPEIIGSGRGLLSAMKQGKLHLIEKYYIHIKKDLQRAGRFVDKDTIRKMKLKQSVKDALLQDIAGIETFLGEELGPRSKEEKYHAAYVRIIMEKLQNDMPLGGEIEEAAKLRRSLG